MSERYQYLGKWGGSPNGGSPTLWRDRQTGDYLLQGYRESDPQVRSELLAIADKSEVPQGEDIIRWPADMVELFRR